MPDKLEEKDKYNEEASEMKEEDKNKKETSEIKEEIDKNSIEYIEKYVLQLDSVKFNENLNNKLKKGMIKLKKNVDLDKLKDNHKKYNSKLKIDLRKIDSNKKNIEDYKKKIETKIDIIKYDLKKDTLSYNIDVEYKDVLNFKKDKIFKDVTTSYRDIRYIEFK